MLGEPGRAVWCAVLVGVKMLEICGEKQSMPKLRLSCVGTQGAPQLPVPGSLGLLLLVVSDRAGWRRLANPVVGLHLGALGQVSRQLPPAHVTPAAGRPGAPTCPCVPVACVMLWLGGSLQPLHLREKQLQLSVTQQPSLVAKPGCP